MTYYERLCGALGCLKNHDIPLDYEQIKQELIEIFRQSSVDENYCLDESTEMKIKALHRKYRTLCLQLQLIRVGELFGKCDYVEV